MKESIKNFIIGLNDEFEGKLISKGPEKYLDKLLNNAEIILHYSNNHLVGCIAFYANDSLNKKAFISFIGVKNDFREKGVGKILLHSSIAYLKKNHFKIYELEVIKENNRALNFYKKQGFEEVEDRGDRILMKIEL